MSRRRHPYRTAYRPALAAALAAVATLLAGPPGPAGAAGPPGARAERRGDDGVAASMQCDRASEPGRVRCTVEARVEGGRTLAWADVEIVALPDFATALKGRIGRDDATSRDATTAKWAFGLVAKKAGQGEARARVRTVVCTPPGESRCAPVVSVVRAPVVVGAP